MKDVQQKLTLGIETSCDETSAAILRGTRELLSCVIATQIPIHQKYGGVVPEIASRNHILSILPVVEQALDEAGTALSEIDQVAVTYGPGLVGALLVGVSAAKSLAFSLDVPLIGVNHLEGHIFANFLAHAELTPPFMALVVSGGHTALVDVADYETFRLMGRTRDDAAGEAFDKVARVMGLPYPGGPEIDRLAREGNPAAIDFPRALAQEGNYEFSFSGLKSAVLNYINSEKMKGHALHKADIAASFQSAVVEVLVHKAFEAIREAGRDTLVLAGGVAANKSLERRLRETTEAEGIRYLYPPARLCTDNAAMIACRGAYAAAASKYSDLYLNAVPGLDFA
mgnify:FL=1